MKKHTLEHWLLQLDTMVAKLDESARLGGLGSKEMEALDSLKIAVVLFETALEEQEQGIRIPPGHGVSNALRSKH
ncbi:MAG TPA: hypothetical protein VIX20_01390 [Ktedonobacteraceae bacterium]